MSSLHFIFAYVELFVAFMFVHSCWYSLFDIVVSCLLVDCWHFWTFTR